MPIDLERERVIPLATVPDLEFIPPGRNGARLSPSTVWRWARDGRLETARIGARRVTSVEAVLRFVEACGPEGPIDHHGNVPPPSPAELEAARLGL